MGFIFIRGSSPSSYISIFKDKARFNNSISMETSGAMPRRTLAQCMMSENRGGNPSIGSGRHFWKKTPQGGAVEVERHAALH